MHEVFVSIGSNTHPKKHVISAVNALAKYYNEVAVSSIYESAPVGFAGANFYNLVAMFYTKDSINDVIRSLKEIENNHGRLRSVAKYSDRTLDIDLLLFDNVTGEFSGNKIPREDITQYAFVLCPLAELAGEKIHPKFRKSFKQMWDDFDKTKQIIWPVEFDWNKPS